MLQRNVTFVEVYLGRWRKSFKSIIQLAVIGFIDK